MTMLYKISDGPLEPHDYGIKLARAIGFPERFIATAERATTALKAQAEARKLNSEERRKAQRRRLLLNLREALMQSERSSMDDAALARYLRQLQMESMYKLQGLENAGRELSVEEVDDEDEDDDYEHPVHDPVEPSSDEVLLIRSIEQDDMVDDNENEVIKG